MVALYLICTLTISVRLCSFHRLKSYLIFSTVIGRSYMHSNIARFILVFFCFTVLPGIALGDKAEVNIEKGVQEFIKSFESLEKRITQNRLNEQKLIKMQNEVDALQLEVTAYRRALAPKIADLKSQLDRLGGQPDKDKGAAPEAEAVKESRERLNKSFGEFDGADKEASLLQAKMVQFRRRIQELRLDSFAREIFRRYDSPLGVKLWARVANDANTGWKLVYADLVPAKKDIASVALVAGFGTFILILLILLARLSQIITRIFRKTDAGEGELAFFRRASYAILVSCVRFLPWVIVSLILFLSLGDLGLFTPEMEELAPTILFALVVFFVVSSISKTVLAPNRPIWRLYPLSDTAARIIYRLIQLIVFVYALNIAWTQLNDVVNAPISLTVGQSSIASLVFAVVLSSIAFIRFQNGDAESNGMRKSRFWPFWLKLPLWGLGLTIIVSASLGYISFARFLSTQVVISGAVIVVAILFYIAIDELTSDIHDENTAVGGWFAKTLELDELRRKQAAYIIGLLLQLVLFAVVTPIILLEWGFSWGDIRSWLIVAFFGVQIGSVNISLSTIMIALGLFIAGIVITRFAQKWLERGPLTVTNFQDGVVDSVRTGVGYLGFALSLLLAISFVGVDFTNIAIVAGALSVGIGFGLQSIVNNFVSGLILLVERPIKVGDWIIVGDKQGFVRRISVRYTEVETFDRSSVIIPNSDLISNTLTNWTHGNTVGRVVVSVGVSYASNAREVHELLLEIGKKHPQCLTYPAPSVVFDKFGDSSLDFSLRIFIANISDILRVSTDLRLDIMDAFHEKNIEIPFPQRDLHIKTGSLLKVETNDKS